MTTPPTLPPFPQRGPIRSKVLPVTMGQAVADARAAGWQVTPRSGPGRVCVQRDWRTAATITPTPVGVVVKPAWTTGQMVLVGIVLAILAVCVGLPRLVGPLNQ